ncbi:MAG: ATP-binding protein [Alphaproteobacteria bacterium]|nr:ATP-binding protein [Alphaproteobacteria bacterium]MCY4231218.1 ATP-binding protein [Alphaproteobacteria bacterium]MCY4319540.1 ATP-binding protein [Alphaproteobacteria bacterium]
MTAHLARFLPRTLFTRSLLIIVMPLILLQVVSTWIFYERHWYIIMKRLAAGVAGEIGLVIDAMDRFPGAEAQGVLLVLLADRTDLRATIAPGAILPNRPQPEPTGGLDKLLARELANRVRRPFQFDTKAYEDEILIRVQLRDSVLNVIAPRRRLFSSTTTFWALWMVGTSMILFAVAGLFMRNQIRPIRRLAEAADAYGKGREAGDPKPGGAAEVRRATVAFRRMRDRIQRQIAQRTEMLAGVSHDLRTPLARMRVALALLPEDDDARGLQADIAEMEAMLEGYLAFARGEGGEPAVETDLGELIEDVVTGARRAGGSIDLRIASAPKIPVQATAIRRCLVNLIDNAMRYGNQVWIACRQRGEWFEIGIDDDGPGVPTADREKVFRPFYRRDRTQPGKPGGVGLGLSIARDVIQSHGGDILLGNSPEGGLGVRVRLPL